MKKSLKIRIIITLISSVLSASVIIAAKASNAFADWYAFNFYPIIQNVFSRISGVLPFSLGEIMVILAVLICIAAVIYFVFRLIKPKISRLKFALSSFVTVCTVLSLTAVMFVFNCGVNYYRSPFSSYSGLEVRKYSKSELKEVLLYTIENVNSLCGQLQLDENGSCVIPENYLSASADAMKMLSEKYPALKAYYPKPKPVMLSYPWCYTKIIGVFTPFSMEANFNTYNPAPSIGFTLCHELSHLSGFMREDEANFIAYLACLESDEIYFRYCGYYQTMGYLLNAYGGVADGDEYGEILSMLHPAAYNHIRMENEFWAKFETPVAVAASAVNDRYLKINNQTDGEKSYGRMVDLVIADYFQNKK